MSELATDLSPRTVKRIQRLADALLTPSTIAHELELHVEDVRRVMREYGVMAGGLPQRCPECGGKVIMPCRHCRLRRQIAAEREMEGAA
jgi:DNA-directed RNA polymerase subunit RPC12/RpoP